MTIRSLAPLALALAAAFSGSAFAQSSVTVYGRVDLLVAQ
jgi:predicted porin